jgi:hypothetical protein
VALHPPSRTSSAVRSRRPSRRATVGSSSCPSSREVSRPFDAPSPGNPLPGATSVSATEPARLAPCRLCRGLSASPRRGFPHPLRSAFVVSRDLDGLLFPEPCDLFQPLTPLGFVFPAPRCRSTVAGRPVCPFARFSKESPVRARGMGHGSGGSRLVGFTVPLSRPVSSVRRSSHRSAWSGSGFPLRSSRSSPATRLVRSLLQAARHVRSVRSVAEPSGLPLPATLAASRQCPSNSTPSQGLPLPFLPDRRLGVSTADARVPSGTNRPDCSVRPVCAPDPAPLGV